MKGIDVLWVGHFDLTNFLGIPAEFKNPVYLKAIRRIAGVAKAHRKGLGFLAADAAWYRDYKAMGFNMLAAGTDQAILAQGWRQILSGRVERVRKTTPRQRRTPRTSRSRSARAWRT